MVNIDQGNFFLTTGDFDNESDAASISGGTTVKINRTDKIEDIFTNAVLFVPIPVSPGNRGTITPYARAIDLKRITRVINVTGILAEKSDERAIDKKKNLMAMARNQNALKGVWGLGNYQTILLPSAQEGIFITRLAFTETPSGLNTEDSVHTTDSASNVVYTRGEMGVIMSLGIGKDLV